MPGLSVPLSAVTPAMAPAGGAVKLTFAAPNVGRIWQGSVVIPNAPSTAIWTIQLGGFTVANLVGNGPFGPLQVGNGQQLVISGTGVGTAALVAYLFGVDDPADNPTPYTGPAALPSPGAPTAVSITGQPIRTAGARALAYGVFNNGDNILPPPVNVWVLYSVMARVNAADSVALASAGASLILGAVNCSTALEYITQDLGGIEVNTPVYYFATNVAQAATISLWYDAA